MSEKNIKTLARVNNTPVQLVEENGCKYIPIKPICDALGVDFEAQRQRIERNKILGSTAFTIKAVAADGKQREMISIPFKFVFGWLFTIDTDRVNEDAQDAVIAYQLECYDVLYKYFVSSAEFYEQKQIKIDNQLDIVKDAKNDFKSARTVLYNAEAELMKLRQLTMDDFDMDRMQLKLNFNPEGGSDENN